MSIIVTIFLLFGGAECEKDNPVGKVEHETQITASLSGNCVGLATIFIDGEDVGSIPPGGAVTKKVSSGVHTVSAFSDKGPWQAVTFDLLPGEQGAHKFDCVKPTLVVELDVLCLGKAKNARVYINGDYQDEILPGTSVSRDLWPGKYTVQGVENGGRNGWSGEVDLKYWGQRKVFSFTCQ